MSNEFVKAIQDADEETEPRFEGLLADYGQNKSYVKKSKDDPTNPLDRSYRSYKFDFDHQIFVIFRPWNECPICYRLFKSDQLPVPEEGDYVCPHTNKAEYLALTRKIIQEGYVANSRKEEILKSGVILISLSWLIPHKKEPIRTEPPKA
jgi:hypothetical protein